MHAHFAVQHGKQALVPPVSRDADAVTFEVTVRAIHNKAGELDFRGPVVQGPVRTRFIYVNSGAYGGDPTSPWNRRAKVSLQAITTAQVDALKASPTMLLEARINGTARDGGPVAASTPLKGAGWQLVES